MEAIQLKLAIISETFPPEVNGVAMTFGVIASELGRRGHQVTVYRPRRADLPGDASHPEFREVAMPGLPIPGYTMLRFGLPARRRFEKLWRLDPPDLVHVVTEGPLGASAISAARALGLPVTSSFHTNFHRYSSSYGFAPLSRPTLAWLRRIHNRTRRTFVPTLELAEELAGLGFENLALLSRGVDLRQFSPSKRDPALRASWGAGPDDLVVLHVGRMAAEKNYPQLLKCYAAMREADPRLRFVLAGDGPLRASLEAQNPGCIFAGAMSRAEIARYYASADIYIHASLSETFGNVLTEAMASGLAVAGFDYAAARQFVVHGENGLVAPCDEPRELEAAAVRLVREPELRRKLGNAAPHSMAQQSWEKVIVRFEADLVAVVAEVRPPSTSRVLVLTASYGEGHNAAARNLAAAFISSQGADSARVVDLFALAAPRTDAFCRRAYLAVINGAPHLWSMIYGWLDRSKGVQAALPVLLARQTRSLAALIARERPAVICSTYPVYAFLLERLAQKGMHLPPHYNIVTDSISINSLWWGAPCAGWFVPNADTAAILEAAGLPADRVHDCGFPTPAFFAVNEGELAPPPLASGGRPRILFIAHSGVRGAEAMAGRLLAEAGWEITVAVGRDEGLRRRLEQVAAGRATPARILGWTDELPRLLMTHHVVVSKAGGATTQEAIAARCPMLVSQIVPGQEEGNYELLRRHGIGAYVDTPEALLDACRRAFADNGAVWSAWRASLEPLARPHAAAAIAGRVLGRVETTMPVLST
ncbi:MAG: glycosyl transferase [Rariglobus sp.]|jgi:glycosyltransferase involved in cell wall biosynthesis/UDP-N-acetylglucosamine:LPS N-acetylglucosamine transferase|nr:glycosyl transferase [Rariglobus sp.]